MLVPKDLFSRPPSAIMYTLLNYIGCCVHQLTGDIKEPFSGRSLGKHAYCSTENDCLGV